MASEKKQISLSSEKEMNSITCPEGGCDLTLMGKDTQQLLEMIQFHQRIKHKSQRLLCPEKGCNTAITITGGDHDPEELIQIHESSQALQTLQHWSSTERDPAQDPRVFDPRL